MAKRNRLRIVVEAFGCRPGSGSEPGVGWNVTQALAEHHDVWVITSRWNRPEIENAVLRDVRVRFAFVDLPRGLERLLLWRGLHFLHSYLWPWAAYREARRLHRTHDFDVAHRMTLATWRYPSFLHRLGIPFVWGPLGGADRVPTGLRPVLGWRGRIWECVRSVAQTAGRFDPFVRRGLRRARVVLAVSPSTQRFLARRFGRDAVVLPAAGIRAAADSSGASRESEPFTVVSVGVLEPLKATQLSLRAFAAARDRLPEDARLVIVGDGTERARLESLARSLGLYAPAVRFTGRLSQREVFHVLARAHVMLFPSLRDAGGMAMLEALAHGLPVIALDHAGPAALLPHGAGIRVAPDTPARVVSRIAAALHRLATDDRLRKSMGRMAQRAVEAVTWERKARVLSRVYRSVSRSHSGHREEGTQWGDPSASIHPSEPRTVQLESSCDTPWPRSRSSSDSPRSRRRSKRVNDASRRKC